MKLRNVVLGALFSGLLLASNGMAEGLTASINVNPVATLATDHLVVIITGTYSCGPIPQPQPPSGPTYADANGVIRQASGKSIAEASFYFNPICDGTTQDFETIANASTMPLHGGKARVEASIWLQYCDESYNCEHVSDSENKQIKIQGGGK